MSDESNPEELEDQEQQQEQTEQTEEEKAYDEVFYSDSGESKPEDQDAEGDPEEDEATGEDRHDEEDQEDEEESADPEQKEGEEGDGVEDEDQPQMVDLKWRGQVITVPIQEAINMAQKNFDATHKYQEASRIRKDAEAKLEILEKIKKGDKKALATLARQAEIDPIDLLDVETDDIEQGTDQQSEPFISPEVKTIMDEVVQDDVLYEELRQVEQILPDPVVDIMAKNPETFYAIIQEVKSGDAKLVLPQVQTKLAQLDSVDQAVIMNNPDAYANFYINVKDSMIREQQQQPQQPESKPRQKQNRNFNETAVRKSGNRSRSRSTAEPDSFESDEAYQAILERIEKQ